MKVRLAGFNVDTDILRRLGRGEELEPTPETLSAAYARISRSPKDITSLRREACRDVRKARRSNQRIIFAMGHHSVAEHAVFNFDIMKVSRLALEEIERFRLASYTEKSQRYVTLDGDFVLPPEIKGEKNSALFQRIVQRQNDFYRRSFSLLSERLAERHPLLLQRSDGQALLEGRAKEDARYVLSLATEGQVGLTLNARNLEHLFRRFALSPLQEVRQLGKKIFSLAAKVAPSLILFPEPSAFDASAYPMLQRAFASLTGMGRMNAEPEIVFSTPTGDDLILAAFVSGQRAVSLPAALDRVRRLGRREKKDLYLKLFQKMEFFDSPPREFEMVEIVFQGLISASCFAQLKRHRLATMLAGPYAPQWGNIVPPSISEIGLEKEFGRIIDMSNAAYQRLAAAGPAAAYILTNSHRRPVLMKMNLRELYHFIRLRNDEHAQWDIRLLAAALQEQVQKRLPLSTLLLCGKSQFADRYERCFGAKPRFLI